MAKDGPPAVQWYPRDFAAAMHRVGASDTFELAYRRALDASFEEGAFGVGSADDWCRWGRVLARNRADFLVTLSLLCVTCDDGTFAQVRMARDRMETVGYRRGQSVSGSLGGRRSAEARAKRIQATLDRPSSDPQADSSSASASASASALESKTPPRATPAAPRGATFTRPTLIEVEAYCAERAAAGHRRVDSRAWFDHYTANGWKVGRNAMKDWRAAVHTWERSEFRGNGSSGKMDARQILEFARTQEAKS